MATTQALPSLMPGFDKEIAKLAQRVLINPRNIDYHTGVLATKVTPGAQMQHRHSTACDPANCFGTACMHPFLLRGQVMHRSAVPQHRSVCPQLATVGHGM